MKLADKIRYLREVEGNLRGLGRAMTQQELVKAIKAESGAGKARGAARESAAGKESTISQSYLSQIESGARPHLTNTTRLLLAKFFKVHPGYLVDDPDGFHTELISEIAGLEDRLDLWLIDGAQRFRRDGRVSQALLAIAKHDVSRKCLSVLQGILETPGLLDRLDSVVGSGMGVRERVAS